MGSSLHITKKGVIDRFEGENAVVLVGDERILLDRSKLPVNAREGSHLLFLKKGISIDKESETKAREKVKSLSDELFE
ncbi:MAG: DUF3006 domain-containing protein [Eubacteriales bacterium]